MDDLGSTSAKLSDAGEPTLAELVQLCAVDSILFSKTFFPKTMRQHTPDFHRDIWQLLDGNGRLVGVQVFRGGAKTSILRIFGAKRIAYGLSHTILCIGKSEGHAVRTVKWLRTQVEYNRLFSETFKLRKGGKWQDTEAEIIHGVDEYPIWVLALGITGSVRGVNLDDFRPDLIIIDDVIDEENSATPEQRIKTENLIHGALKESLAPASEMPDAKMVMLQTPLNKEDASVKAFDDPEWTCARFGCWTPETEDMPVDRQRSIWPARWTDETLRNEKRAAAKRNAISIFLREKECKLTSPETSAFDENWLQFYDLAPERHEMDVVMSLDPVPPPTDIQIAKGMRGKDFEAFAVCGRYKDRFFLLDYSLNRGHTPDWTIAEFFRLAAFWKPRVITVETVAYQKTLAWLLREAMKHQRKYYVIDEMVDRRSKYDRIVDGLQGITSNKQFYVLDSHTDFISQFRTYPDVSNDDLIEVVSVACRKLQDHYFSGAEDDDIDIDIMREEKDIPALVYRSGAP